MDFISQYLLYNSGNMVPRVYHRWSAISILAMTLGRKVYVDQKYYRVHPSMYMCLVGEQGTRKSSAKDLAFDMFHTIFEDYPLGASVQSREKTVERLSGDEYQRAFIDIDGCSIEYKPLAFFINEFKNFLSINPAGMIEFLTDIYDTKKFAADTLKHGLQPVVNPCINILACETPDWIIDKLKLNIIAGGFSRRMIYVYETEYPPRITFPDITPPMAEAKDWCMRHLVKASELIGPFEWEPTARAFFKDWFENLPRPTDKILAGFYEAKDTIVMKIAMCLAAAEENPRRVLTLEIIQMAIALLLADVERNLPRLTAGSGRNELAMPTQRILELLASNDGWLPEKKLLIEMERDVNGIELFNIFRSLKSTDRIFVEDVQFPTCKRVMVMTPERWKKWKLDGQPNK